MEPLRIVVADDHREFRVCLKEFLETRHDIEVIGQAANGFEAVMLAKSCHPDLILMDISMPKLDGLNAAREIKRDFPEIAIVVISLFDGPKYRALAKSIGIEDFLSKGSLVKELSQSLKRIRALIEERRKDYAESGILEARG